MRPAVTYSPCAKSSREGNCDIITSVHFEEGNPISETNSPFETRNHAKSGDETDDDSIMPPILSEEEMNAMDSGYESDDGGQSRPKVHRRESRYKIHDYIRQIQSE